MNHLRFHWFRFLIPLMIFVLGCPPPQPPRDAPDVDRTIEAGQPVGGVPGLAIMGRTSYLAPDSLGALLIQVEDPNTGEIEPEALVQVILNMADGAQQELFTGQTDEMGLVRANFDVPTDLTAQDATLTVLADTANAGQLVSSQEIYIGRAYNLLVTTDKPVYQPGQVIHLRTLALDSNALSAAQGESLIVTVTDPEGNKLMRRALPTSTFGVAAADFTLDTQAMSGDYILTAEMGPVRSSRSVEVKPYTLPRFAISFASEKSFYLPGEVVTGTVDAQYYFGKPVAGGQVTLRGFVTDGERFQVVEVHGETDEAGRYHYEFEAPDYFAGQLENDSATVDIEIEVIDTANHSERIDTSLTVAEQTILVEAVAESGTLRPGLENIVYLQSTFPTGDPARTTMTVTSAVDSTKVISDAIVVTTDDNGLATFTLTPSREQPLSVLALEIEATNTDGQRAYQPLLLGLSRRSATSLLLRPEQVEYRIGETLNVDIHVATPGSTIAPTATSTVYLDVIKDGQTFGLAPLPVTAGVAQAAIELDGSLLGTIELNAYMVVVDEDGRSEIVFDRRYVLVNPAPADVMVTTDAEVYRPGDTATLDISVQREGAPMPSAIGLSIVDESVFALGTQDPGFARTFFLLDRELQEPRYEIDGFAPLRDQDPSAYDEIAAHDHSQQRESRQRALAGFFAEELAAISDMQPTLAVADVESADGLVQMHASTLVNDWGWMNRIALVTPLIGMALYDGTRRRRRLFIGLVLIGGMLFWASCAAPPAAAPAADFADAEAMGESEATTASRGDLGQPPRLRQFFPETLFWLPDLTTDAEGRVQVEVPIADSITTWRVSVLASDQNGTLGSAAVPMRVFQDFFVEPDLPRVLTVGDEVAVPVSVFNYLDEAQEIVLDVTAAPWFEFVTTGQETATQQRFTVQANEVSAIYLPIRVLDVGEHEFQITATGNTMSDAVLKTVEVLPDGRPMATAESGTLQPIQRFAIDIPADVVTGTAQVMVKIYPGIVSQIVDGLEGMLQQPYGCFEQTSSTTYPNVLVLDYLQTTEQSDLALERRAEHFINLGYQRLVGFEVDGMPGGFSLFGDPPPQTMLTAYGLMEFTDMSQVSYVDPALIERTAFFLMQRQQADGSWQPQGMTIESGLEDLGDTALLPTAYVIWALADAGYADSGPVQSGVDYLLTNLQPYLPSQDAPAEQLDPYATALIANSLVAAAPEQTSETIAQLIEQLRNSANTSPQGYYSWSSGMSTYMGGHSQVSDIETAAMTAIVLLRLGEQLDVAQGAIDWIVSQRDPNGMFYSTQTTVLALKALLFAVETQNAAGDATVTVTLNNEHVQTLTVTDETSDLVQLVRFDGVVLNRGEGQNELAISVEGDRQLQYQVITDYYLPWELVAMTPPDEETVRIDVHYDRTQFQVNDIVTATASVELLAPGGAGTLLVDLAVPPGFRPLGEDWDALVARRIIQRYELTERQIIVYLTDVPSGAHYTFDYRLQARFPIDAQTGSSAVYNYYTPEQQAIQQPQRITVTLGVPRK